ncbi:MAG: hypothetical protein GXP31_18330 [Kiritimatiellaeota bacterium]|nr:hypothetical protein [Kiritimatiellota bacterium]
MKRTWLKIGVLSLCFAGAAIGRQWGPAFKAKDMTLDRGVQLLNVNDVGDFSISYRCRIDAAGLVELMFRYDIDSDVYYLFRIDTRSSGGNPPGFLKRSPGESFWHLCGSRTGTAPKSGEWVDVRVEGVGGAGASEPSWGVKLWRRCGMTTTSAASWPSGGSSAPARSGMSAFPFRREKF